MNRSRTVSVILVLIVALIGSAVAVLVTGGQDTKRLAANFPNTINLYEGAEVKILGVPVGHVTSVEVQGTQVHVEMDYKSQHRLPQDVHAVIVPPSIVGDRFVQLTPTYTGGPVLADGATVSPQRTAVPIELDQTYRTLNELATALGPQGANSDGALSRLISALAENLRGNGEAFNSTTKRFAGAVDTLANSRQNIAGTVSSLNRVTQTLAGQDDQVRDLISNLATVSTELNNERGNLAQATTTLDQALNQIATFVKHNKGAVTKNVHGLTEVTDTLAQHSDELARTLDILPVGATNLFKLFVPANFDPHHGGEVPVEARKTAVAARAAGTFIPDLMTQLGFSTTALCAQLPEQQQQQLAGLCGALQKTGADLGTVITELLNPALGPGLTTNDPTQTLSGLLRGGHP